MVEDELIRESEITETRGRFSVLKTNVPLSLPGCYGIYDRFTGKWYVGQTGSVSNRRKQHEGDIKKNRSISFYSEIKTLDDFSRFVFVPLYYVWVQRKLLNRVEETIIANFNCVEPNGYNTYTGRSDPRVYEKMRTPEATAKRNAKFATEQLRQLRRDAMAVPGRTEAARDTLNSPESIAKRRQTALVTFSTPEFKTRFGEKMREVNAADPTIAERKRNKMKAYWAERHAKYGPTGKPPKD